MAMKEAFSGDYGVVSNEGSVELQRQVHGLMEEQGAIPHWVIEYRPTREVALGPVETKSALRKELVSRFKPEGYKHFENAYKTARNTDHISWRARYRIYRQVRETVNLKANLIFSGEDPAFASRHIEEGEQYKTGDVIVTHGAFGLGSDSFHAKKR